MQSRWWPSFAAAMKPSTEVEATQTGGCGFCTTRGRIETPGMS
jgi:hypothetical protein